MTLKWIQCQGDVWCKLSTVKLQHEHFDNLHGVYIIWHGGNNAATVYVGKGNIRERLTQHRSNPSIQNYEQLGPLYVTWAAVPNNLCDGVERFLIDTLHPKVNEQIPIVTPIPVNKPW